MRVGVAAIIDGRPDMTTVAQASTGEEAIEQTSAISRTSP